MAKLAWAGILLGLALWWCADRGHAERLPLQVPARAAASRFGGKFELVPLFDAGHRPVIRNGHQYQAERNEISFRTDAGDTVTIYPGETTDGASIPAFLWPWLPPDGPYFEDAAFHDECFKSRGTFAFHGKVGRTRAEPYDYHGCNEILREAMVASGVPAWKRVVIFEAVELFGRGAFGR